MTEQTHVTVDLRNVQENVGDGMRRARNISRKGALAYTGLLTMAYDKVKDFFVEGKELIDRAEARGEEVEAELNQKVRNAEVDAKERLRKISRRTRRSAEAQVDAAAREMGAEVSTLEGEMERRVERVLARLGLPTRDRLDRLSREIETLSAKIDGRTINEESAMTVAEVSIVEAPVVEMDVVEMDVVEMDVVETPQILTPDMDRSTNVTAMPIEEYDSLKIRDIKEQLDELDYAQLTYVRTHEVANANRVTLLAEIDRRMDEMKIEVA